MVEESGEFNTFKTKLKETEPSVRTIQPNAFDVEMASATMTSSPPPPPSTLEGSSQPMTATTTEPLPPPYEELIKIWKRNYGKLVSTKSPIKIENVPHIVKSLVHDIADEVAAIGTNAETVLGKERYLFTKQEIGGFACTALLKSLQNWMLSEKLNQYIYDNEEIEAIVISILKHFNTVYAGAPLRIINYASMLYSTREDKFTPTVSVMTHEWLISQAQSALHAFDETLRRAERGETIDPNIDVFIEPEQVKHLQLLASGGLPWGYEPVDAPFQRFRHIDPISMIFDVEAFRRNGDRCVVVLSEQVYFSYLALAKVEMEKAEESLRTRPSESISEEELALTNDFITHLKKIVNDACLPAPFVMKQDHLPIPPTPPIATPPSPSTSGGGATEQIMTAEHTSDTIPMNDE